MSRPRIQEFWQNVDRRGPDDCWLWLGKLTDDGYGSFTATLRGKQVWKAHRYSWLLNVGEIPGKRLVCHSCDNPACVNPDHLWLGTHKQNQLDMQIKGRQVRGRKHGSVKLTEEQVLEAYHSIEASLRQSTAENRQTK